jgi:hypothetical protein
MGVCKLIFPRALEIRANEKWGFDRVRPQDRRGKVKTLLEEGNIMKLYWLHIPGLQKRPKISPAWDQRGAGLPDIAVPMETPMKTPMGLR